MKMISPAKLRFALGLFALSMTLPVLAADPKSDVIEKTFTLSGPGKLVANVESGSLTVSGSETKTVTVKVTRDAENSTDSEAAKLLKEYQVTITQDGNTIRAEGKAPRSQRWGWNKPQLRVKFEIIVPTKTDAELSVSGGNAKVADLTGTISTKTAGGSIAATKLTGTVSFQTSGGSVQAESIAGDLSAKTAGGNIGLKTVEGGKVDASTSGGSIAIAGASGKFNLRTAGGNIKLEEGKGTVDASTSGGNVTLQLTEAPKEAMSLKTAGGNISLKVPGTTSANLDASASGGTVTCDLPVTIQGTAKSHSIVGKMGEGGPDLNLRTSGGNIRIGKN